MCLIYVSSTRAIDPLIYIQVIQLLGNDCWSCVHWDIDLIWGLTPNMRDHVWQADSTNYCGLDPLWYANLPVSLLPVYQLTPAALGSTLVDCFEHVPVAAVYMSIPNWWVMSVVVVVVALVTYVLYIYRLFNKHLYTHAHKQIPRCSCQVKVGQIPRCSYYTKYPAVAHTLDQP